MEPSEEAEEPIPQPRVSGTVRTERDGRKRTTTNHYFLFDQDPMFIPADEWIEVVWDK